jgi:hypothetical protein
MKQDQQESLVEKQKGSTSKNQQDALKIKIVSAIIIVTTVWYLISLIVNISYHNITDLSVVSVQGNILVILTNFLSAAVCCFLVFKLAKLYSERKALVSLILIGYFTFNILSSIIAGIREIFIFSSPRLNDFFALNTAFLIPASTMFILFFVIEVFYKGILINPQKKYFLAVSLLSSILFVVALIISLIGVENGIFALEGFIKFPIIFFAMINIFFNFVLYIVLTVKSFGLRSRIKEEKGKKFLLLFGISGVLLGCTYFGKLPFHLVFGSTATSPVYTVVRIIADIVYLVAYVLLFMGVSKPD